MPLIRIPEAAKRLGMTLHGSRRALKNAGVPLVRINLRALTVEEEDLQCFIEERTRAGYGGRGRPPKKKPQD